MKFFEASIDSIDSIQPGKTHYVHELRSEQAENIKYDDNIKSQIIVIITVHIFP